MFKKLITFIKLRRMSRMIDILADLCDSRSCENCEAYLRDDICTKKPACAQWYVLEQYRNDVERFRKELENEKKR